LLHVRVIEASSAPLQLILELENEIFARGKNATYLISEYTFDPLNVLLALNCISLPIYAVFVPQISEYDKDVVRLSIFDKVTQDPL
jgi:hypothetical protein